MKLKHFQKFDQSQTATNESTAIIEGKVSPLLASLLDTIKGEKAVSLAVADPKLGKSFTSITHLGDGNILMHTVNGKATP
jgi:nucleolar protein 58